MFTLGIGRIQYSFIDKNGIDGIGWINYQGNSQNEKNIIAEIAKILIFEHAIDVDKVKINSIMGRGIKNVSFEWFQI